MSYRNPKIIEDRSGEILARGLSQGMAGLAKGITDLGTLRKEERKQRQLQQEKWTKSLNELDQKLATDPAYLNAGYQKLGDTVMAGAQSAGEYVTQGLYNIYGPTVTGARLGREGAQEAQRLKGEIGINNKAIETVIGHSTSYPDLAKEINHANNREFLVTDADGKTDRSETFLKAVNNIEGFSGKFENRNANGLWWVVNGPYGSYEVPARDVPDTYSNLTANFPNAQHKLMEEIPSLFYNEKGDEFLPNLTNNEEIKKEIITNDRGQKVVETKQFLNTAVVNTKRESLMNTTLGAIDGAKTNRQAQDTYLDDLAIVDEKGIPVSSEDWQKLDSITKQKYVYSSVDKTWFDETKIKEVVPGDPKQGYYRSTFSKPIEEDKKGKKSASFAVQAEEAIANKKFKEFKEIAGNTNIEDLLGLSPTMDGKTSSYVLQYFPAAEGSTIIGLREYNPKDKNASEDRRNYDLTNKANVMSLLKKMGAIGEGRYKQLGEIADVIVARYSKPTAGPVQTPLVGPLNQPE
jgi:hypothetical protein